MEYRRRELQIRMYHDALYYKTHDPTHNLHRAFKIQQHRQRNHYLKGYAVKYGSPFSKAIWWSHELNVPKPTILSQPRPNFPPSRVRLLPFPPLCPFPNYNKPTVPQPHEDAILSTINPTTTISI